MISNGLVNPRKALLSAFCVAAIGCLVLPAWFHSRRRLKSVPQHDFLSE
jgi:hypothetical protein